MLEFKFNKQVFNNDEINPNLEISRFKMIETYRYGLYSIVGKYIGEEKFNGKLKEKVGGIFTRALICSYTGKDKDPVIPDNFKYDIIIRDLKQKIDSIEIEIKIESEIKELIFEFPKNLNGNVKITVNEENENIIMGDRNNKKYLINVNKDLYEKLFNKAFTVNLFKGDINVLIWCLLKRYRTLNGSNNHLAVPENIQRRMGIEFELFGSAFNSIQRTEKELKISKQRYCSLFYDIEKYFGSCGSIFNFEPISGIYSFNPPYDTFIMEKAIEYILSFFRGRYLKIAGVIPAWDNESRLKLNYPPLNYAKYGLTGYRTLKLIKESKHLKEIKLCPEDEFKYTNYLARGFPLVSVCPTHKFILSSQ